MTAKTIILSSAGLKNVIPRVDSGDEFDFIFGNHKMKLNNLFADFISPAVSRIHKSDPTTNYIDFTNKIEKLKITEEVLLLIQQLSTGSSVEVKDDQIIQLQSISILLENEELFSAIDDKFNIDINESNIDQYLTILTFFSQNSKSSNFINCSGIINYISSHFYDIDESKVKELPLCTVYSIISNENLVIESEDSLYEFIKELFKERRENENESEIEKMSFFEEIEFIRLSEDKFNDFIENFSSGEMTGTLWKKLCKCFYTNMKKSSPNDVKNGRYFKGQRIEFDGNEYHRFEWIIHYLTQKCGGNVSDKGIVNVTASSVDYTEFPKHAVDLHNTQNYFQANNDPKDWLRYDFVENRVCITHYSIRTRHDCDDMHPRSWVVEGSDTGGENDSEWTILDSHQNDSTLQGKSFSYTFDIKPTQVNKKFYCYLRIRQTGPNSNNNHYTCISALEYFGILKEE